MTPKQLVSHGEHQDEWGGYFVVKGKERLVRLLLGTRRNFPTAVQRNTWKNKDQYFSDLGIMIRCVKDDLTTVVSFTKNYFHVAVQINLTLCIFSVFSLILYTF